jgi:hypothetical protein
VKRAGGVFYYSKWRVFGGKGIARQSMVCAHNTQHRRTTKEEVAKAFFVFGQTIFSLELSSESIGKNSLIDRL